jgi:hypothetical protein
MDARTHYARYRREHPETPARFAWGYAKHMAQVDAIDAAADWEWSADANLIAVATIDGIELRAYVDYEPYEWGDIEPSDDERARLQVIGVGVRVVGDDDDLDSIWGVAWLDGDSSLTAGTISTAIGYGFIDRARDEIAERTRLAGYVKTIAEQL